MHSYCTPLQRLIVLHYLRIYQLEVDQLVGFTDDQVWQYLAITS